MDTATVPLGLAFLAGFASFLSPCVLPIVPGYVSFVTGMTLDELKHGDTAAARRHAATHAGLFILGFSLLFVALGAAATAVGTALGRSLSLLQQLGGIVIVVFGLYMLGVLPIPAFLRERRIHMAVRPAGGIGSVMAGVAFGAGWTPCVGPVLASILLYAGMKATMLEGILLLGIYALGLGIPFFISAVALNAYLAGAGWLRPWLGRIEQATGAFMVLVGALLFTGRFAALSGFLAGFGQLINLGS